MIKTIGYAIAAVILVGGGVVIGSWLFGAKDAPASSSAAGSTFNTAKVAQVSLNLASPGANGTSTSITNNDANDRIVTAVKIGCQGVGTSKTAYSGTGLANLLFTLGTTSASAPAAYPTGFNKIGGVDYALSTSTPNTLVASSTAGVSTTSLIWAAGSNLTIFSNATNTATCTAGVDYMAS